MNTGNHPSPSKWSRWRELVVNALVEWLPFSPGRVLRRLMYRTIFARVGTSAQIFPGFEFLHADSIEIGNQTKIESNVRFKNFSQNSKILIGDGARIDRGVSIKAYGSGSVEIGENTFVGPYVCLAGESISIGKHCLISSHTGIYAINHNFADPTRKIQAQGVSYEGIVIEDDCWIGSGVRVVDGVTIGQGSVIGAGAVVTKDILPYSVAVGVPARTISNRKFSKMNSMQNKGYTYKNSDRLPTGLSVALAEVEEAAELIRAEVEDLAKLLHQPLESLTDTIPAHQVLQNLLHQLFECIHQVMAVDTIAILLQTEDGQHVAVQATLGLEEEIAQGIRIPIGRGFAGRIAASCKLTIVDDLSKVEVVSPILRNKGIQSMLGVPLLVENRMFGVFHVGTIRPRHFTKDDAQLLQLVGDRIALAIHHLEISKPSVARDSEFAWEKVTLAYLYQTMSRVVGFPFHLHPAGFPELAPLLQLASTAC